MKSSDSRIYREGLLFVGIEFLLVKGKLWILFLGELITETCDIANEAGV